MIIYTCVHQRPEIFQKFINNLPNYPLVAVGDRNDPCREICGAANQTFVEFPNKPLGKKFNRGLQLLKELDWEYVFITGSDDIFETRVFELYKTFNYHYVGLLDFYFYDGKYLQYFKGFFKERRGEPLGAGRMLHRNVLEALNWKLWDDNINKNLDGSMHKKLQGIMDLTTKFINLKEQDLLAVDLKSDVNIWQTKHWEGLKYADTKLLKRVKL